MVKAQTIHGTLLEVLAIGQERIEGASSIAASFAREPTRIPQRVFVRHTIEHVHRIRLFRSIDLLAFRLLKTINYRAGLVWGSYARSEAVHDRYFLSDLKSIGLHRCDVMAVPPFASTSHLKMFIEQSSRVFGPLPVVLYSFWVEENSEIGSARIIECMRDTFGFCATRGASAHRKLDMNLKHSEVVSQVLASIIQGDDDLLLAAHLLDSITDFICEYFVELNTWNDAPSSLNAAREIPELTPALILS